MRVSYEIKDTLTSKSGKWHRNKFRIFKKVIQKGLSMSPFMVFVQGFLGLKTPNLLPPPCRIEEAAIVA